MTEYGMFLAAMKANPVEDSCYAVTSSLWPKGEAPPRRRRPQYEPDDPIQLADILAVKPRDRGLYWTEWLLQNVDALDALYAVVHERVEAIRDGAFGQALREALGI